MGFSGACTAALIVTPGLLELNLPLSPAAAFSVLRVAIGSALQGGCVGGEVAIDEERGIAGILGVCLRLRERPCGAKSETGPDEPAACLHEPVPDMRYRCVCFSGHRSPGTAGHRRWARRNLCRDWPGSTGRR